MRAAWIDALICSTGLLVNEVQYIDAELIAVNLGLSGSAMTHVSLSDVKDQKKMSIPPFPFAGDRNHRNKSTTTSTTSQIGIVQTKSEITASTIKIETT